MLEILIISLILLGLVLSGIAMFLVVTSFIEEGASTTPVSKPKQRQNTKSKKRPSKQKSGSSKKLNLPFMNKNKESKRKRIKQMIDDEDGIFDKEDSDFVFGDTSFEEDDFGLPKERVNNKRAESFNFGEYDEIEGLETLNGSEEEEEISSAGEYSDFLSQFEEEPVSKNYDNKSFTPSQETGGYKEQETTDSYESSNDEIDLSRYASVINNDESEEKMGTEEKDDLSFLKNYDFGNSESSEPESNESESKGKDEEDVEDYDDIAERFKRLQKIVNKDNKE